MTLPMPVLEHACDLHTALAPIRELGQGRAGRRRIVPIVGGEVHGPLINGRILDSGADWQTVFADGLAEIDTRHALETDDGALIELRNYGFRHGPPEVLASIARGDDVPPEAYYMRTHARLETGDERYAWVNRTVFVGTGAKIGDRVVVSLFAVR